MHTMKERLGPKTEKQARLAVAAARFVELGSESSSTRETLSVVKEAGYRNTGWGGKVLHQFVEEERTRKRERRPTFLAEILQRSAKKAALGSSSNETLPNSRSSRF